jgi:predicted dehydrogenase
MRVLFCGLGSIGQRHLRNLLEITSGDIEVLAYRARGQQITLRDNLTVEEGINLEEKYNVRTFTSLNEALKYHPEIVFITNPSSLHQEILKALLDKSNADIFVEKPLSHTLDGLPELVEKAKRKGIKVFVGFQNRFHPCIIRAKELLDSRAIGSIMAANLEVAEYMPGFHKYEDYRDLYTSRKELGGGVVLTQIHEIDYAYHFFGMPQIIYAMGGKHSHLEIDVEDTASILLGYNCHESQFPVHIHMDFIQNPPSRGCKIIGSHGRIEFDLINLSIVCFDENGDVKLKETYDKFNRNDMFIEELELFLSIRRGETEPTLTMEDGMRSLEIALAVKQSMKEKRIINLREIHSA